MLCGDTATKQPHRLVTDIETALMQKVLNISKRKRRDIHHHRKADDLGQGFEVPEGGARCLSK